MNNTRRQLLKSIPAAGVAGALFALSGSAVSAECPAMSKKSANGDDAGASTSVTQGWK